MKSNSISHPVRSLDDGIQCFKQLSITNDCFCHHTTVNNMETLRSGHFNEICSMETNSFVISRNKRLE